MYTSTQASVLTAQFISTIPGMGDSPVLMPSARQTRKVNISKKVMSRLFG